MATSFGIDTYQSCKGKAKEIAKTKQFVMRYYFSQSQYKQEFMRAEALELSQAGLFIGVMWENGRPASDPYFTITRAAADAAGAWYVPRRSASRKIPSSSSRWTVTTNTLTTWLPTSRNARRIQRHRLHPRLLRVGPDLQGAQGCRLVTNTWLTEFPWVSGLPRVVPQPRTSCRGRLPSSWAWMLIWTQLLGIQVAGSLRSSLKVEP